MSRAEGTGRSSLEVSMQKVAICAAILKGILFCIFRTSLISLARIVVIQAVKDTLDEQSFKSIEELLFTASDPVLDVIFLEGLTFQEAFWLVVGIVFLLGNVYGVLRAVPVWLGSKRGRRLRKLVFRKALMNKKGYFDIQRSASNEVVYKHIGSIEEYESKYRYLLIDAVTSIIFPIILMLMVSWLIGLWFLGAAVVLLSWDAGFRVLTSKWEKIRVNKWNDTNACLADMLNSRDTVRGHGMETVEYKRLNHTMGMDGVELRKILAGIFVREGVLTVLFSVTAPLWFAHSMAYDTTVDHVFRLLVAILLMDEAMRSFLALEILMQSRAAALHAQDMIKKKLGIDENETLDDTLETDKSDSSTSVNFENEHKIQSLLSEARPGTMIATTNNGHFASKSLHCNKLCLGYRSHGADMEDLDLMPDRKPKESEHKNAVVFNNLLLDIRLGSRYALLGESGSGKSTFFKTLAGLLPSLSGEIRIKLGGDAHGTIIEPLDWAWRRSVAIVTQDTLLFNRTLRENLCYGHKMAQTQKQNKGQKGSPLTEETEFGMTEENILLPSLTDEQIFEALRKVNLEDMVNQLPNGLSTQIRHHGNEFSGGQRQRIQLARLFLSNASILLLDEPTSALDEATSLQVLENLKAFTEGKTLVLVTHDPLARQLANNEFEVHLKEDGSKIIELKHSGTINSTQSTTFPTVSPAKVVANETRGDTSKSPDPSTQFYSYDRQFVAPKQATQSTAL
eukprot:m.22511 g.22511  ORF g.22511 m.22511 type:complete len:736 (+) comp7407_c0_seq1:72-2279(+)